MKPNPALVMKDIDFSRAAKAVEEVAKANAVPTTVYPTVEPVKPLPAADLETPAFELIAEGPPVVLKVPVADLLHRWIKDEAEKERSTKLYIILKALKKAGAPIDLKATAKDGRRVR